MQTRKTSREEETRKIMKPTYIKIKRSLVVDLMKHLGTIRPKLQTPKNYNTKERTNDALLLELKETLKKEA